MPGIAEILLGAAPIAGGALVGVAAGNLRGPDVRGQIKQDLDLLERIPPEDTERRANVQDSINRRIDELVEAADRGRAMREAALSYRGNWRDIFLFSECPPVRLHLVARQPQQNQLADDIHLDDRVVRRRRRVRAAWRASGAASLLSPPQRRRARSATQRVSAESNKSCIAIQCRSRGLGVVGSVVRNRETVPGGIDLDLVLDARCGKRLLQRFGLLGGERPSFSAPAT